MKVYSKFQDDTFAELYGEPDANGVQAALITDPSKNGGVPFNGLTKPLEWSPTPLIPLPEAAPKELYVIVYVAPDNSISYELVYSFREVETSSNIYGFVGYFTIVPPPRISPLTPKGS